VESLGGKPRDHTFHDGYFLSVNKGRENIIMATPENTMREKRS
jgi:hypothetical protein